MALQQEQSPTRHQTKVDSYEDPSQVALSKDHNSIRFANDPMALQQKHSPTRPVDSPNTKVASYKDPSQVALYEDPNSTRFANDSSRLVVLTIQLCDYA